MSGRIYTFRSFYPISNMAKERQLVGKAQGDRNICCVLCMLADCVFKYGHRLSHICRDRYFGTRPPYLGCDVWEQVSLNRPHLTMDLPSVLHFPLPSHLYLRICDLSVIAIQYASKGYSVRIWNSYTEAWFLTSQTLIVVLPSSPITPLSSPISSTFTQIQYFLECSPRPSFVRTMRCIVFRLLSTHYAYSLSSPGVILHLSFNTLCFHTKFVGVLTHFKQVTFGLLSQVKVGSHLHGFLGQAYVLPLDSF